MDTAQKVEQWKKGNQDKNNKFLITVYEESLENMCTDCTQFFHIEMERH
jgi:hypothetical protein